MYEYNQYYFCIWLLVNRTCIMNYSISYINTLTHMHFLTIPIKGPEKKNRIPDEETNWCTAFHEAGHTLVGFYTKDATPLHKVTIMPRGQSLGHVCISLLGTACFTSKQNEKNHTKKRRTKPSCSGPIPAQKLRVHSVPRVVFSHLMPNMDFYYFHNSRWEKIH